MYYYNLGGIGMPGNDLTGNHTIGGVQLLNIQPGYWTGTEVNVNDAYDFTFDDGGQTITTKEGVIRQPWAVRDGDVGPSTVMIDIKPGSDPNSINPHSKGKIPVAILSTNTGNGDLLDFDATQVDALSVEFGPDGAADTHGRGHVEDVDGDGDPDLVLYFKTQQTGILCGDSAASLTGETFSGDAIQGTDSINTVGC
jgi:hypothetical protein